MNPIPENIRKCMDAADRKKYGLPTIQELEKQVRQAKEMTIREVFGQSELELHDQFISFLRRFGLGYYHADPTRKSTIQSGMPDFGVYDESRIFWIEFKTGRNDLSVAQKAQVAKMIERHNVVFICRSYEQATELTKKFFHLGDSV